MILKSSSKNPRQMVGTMSKFTFNCIMLALSEVKAWSKKDDANLDTLKWCEKLESSLTKHSYFDVENAELRVSIFPEEIGFLVEILAFNVGSERDIMPPDIFVQLLQGGKVKFWK